MLTREDLKFNGVVVSECLEMEALSHTVGIGGGAVMAVNAGCDIVLLCRSPSVQQEAISGLKLGIENSIISLGRIKQSLRRVLKMKADSPICTWENALNPAGPPLLLNLQPSHTQLSTKAYNQSISVVRDRNDYLPLSNILEPEEELLVLTPLVKPLAASAASRTFSDSIDGFSPDHHSWDRTASIMSGESVFKELGRSLARQRSGRVLHTSYTANGVRPVHENLIERAGAVIIVTADANRNLYQNGFTKHVSMICKMQKASGKGEKPLIVISVSSPYDFAMDLNTISTYICTYDFTETALNSLVGILYGNLTATGSLPGSISQTQQVHQSRQHWLVEAFKEERDANALDTLLKAVVDDTDPSELSEVKNATSNSFLLRDAEVVEAHLVVRNSSTQRLYGFCSTYYFKNTATGVIGAIIVDPQRRKLSIGASLHTRAIRTLLQQDKIQRFQLGSRLPSIYLGVPVGRGSESKRLRSWFANLGWHSAVSRPVCSMVARHLQTWNVPDGMARSLQTAQHTVEFDLVYGYTDVGSHIFEHVKTSSRQGIAEVYRLALADPSACGIIRARRVQDNAVVGTIVLYNDRSTIADFVPGMKAFNVLTGGMSSPIISPSAGEYSTILQSLVLLGMKQVKQQGCEVCILDCMDGDGTTGSLSAMGFEPLHSFEDITCDAATFSMIPPSRAQVPG